MTDLKSYLAEKYMSGPKADAILARTKKKKRKKAGDGDQNQASASMIRDEDAGFGFGFQNKKYDDDDEVEEEDEKAIVASDRTFKKRRKIVAEEGGGGWTTLQEPARETTPPPAPDELPIIVSEEPEFTGGLVSAAQFKKVLPTPAAANPEAGTTADEAALAQETVYRDSSGRKIDTKVAQEEAARRKRLKEERDAKKLEWGKGLVQRKEAEKRREDLKKAGSTSFARRADDKDLNEEQKAKELWNDPAAAFLTKKRTKGPKKPEYNGPAPPPNRFGIKPGYRWDGVDRGNGFEKKLYQTMNERKRKDQQAYAWGVDDM